MSNIAIEFFDFSLLLLVKLFLFASFIVFLCFTFISLSIVVAVSLTLSISLPLILPSLLRARKSNNYQIAIVRRSILHNTDNKVIALNLLCFIFCIISLLLLHFSFYSCRSFSLDSD